MDSASFRFVVFGLAIALLSNLSSARPWRAAVLLVGSFLFLGALETRPSAFLPLAGFLLLGYVGLVLLQWERKSLMTWSIIAVLLVYVWLKRYTFLPQHMLLHSPYFTLGLSYIFFRVLHLIIETGNGDEQRRIGPTAYLLYTLNFATLVSGPIQRYDEFARDQFAEQPIALGPRLVGLQLERIVRGFFKVNVLALLLDMVRIDALAQLTHAAPLSVRLFAAFRLVIVYPIFLYANFSGYIDIVIALARLMRVRLPENFNRPFSAASVLDFWTQWHMTLSNWLKTYVYNPLLITLMRRIPSSSLEPFISVFCIFVTFFLIGIWHGRTSEFVVYGLLLGAGTSVNQTWRMGFERRLGRKGYRALAKNMVYVTLGRGLNFIWFAFTLFCFWANWPLIERLIDSLGLAQWLAVWGAAWLAASVVLASWEMLRSRLLSLDSPAGCLLTHRYARMVFASAFALVAFIVTCLLNQPAPAIVYKVF